MKIKDWIVIILQRLECLSRNYPAIIKNRLLSAVIFYIREDLVLCIVILH